MIISFRALISLWSRKYRLCSLKSKLFLWLKLLIKIIKFIKLCVLIELKRYWLLIISFILIIWVKRLIKWQIIINLFFLKKQILIRLLICFKIMLCLFDLIYRNMIFKLLIKIFIEFIWIICPNKITFFIIMDLFFRVNRFNLGLK